MTDVQDPSVSESAADRVNRRFAGVGAALGLLLWLNLFGAPMMVASAVLLKTHPTLSPLFAFLGMLCVAGGTLWVASSAFGTQWRQAFPLARVRMGTLVWTVLVILASLPVVFAWIAWAERVVGLSSLPNPLPMVGVWGVVVGAPLAEELLFRGYGLARIKALGGERRALVLTALMFSLSHGSWVKLPGTFLMGLVLGWLVLQTGSLWPALMGHVTNNATALILDRFGTSPALDSKSASWWVVGGMLLGGLGMLAVLASPQVRRRWVPELAPR